jgi:hypothetical protein
MGFSLVAIIEKIKQGIFARGNGEKIKQGIP